VVEMKGGGKGRKEGSHAFLEGFGHGIACLASVVSKVDPRRKALLQASCSVADTPGPAPQRSCDVSSRRKRYGEKKHLTPPSMEKSTCSWYYPILVTVKEGTLNRKVESLVDFLKRTLSSWNSVECITVDPRSEIFELDPYFALVIDVYFKDSVPSAQARRAAFGDPGDFETASSGTKDRFFLDELPIRIEYKDIALIDRLLERPLLYLKLLKNSGTYPFYRLESNKVIFDAGGAASGGAASGGAASGWIGEARERLSNFPDDAWIALGDSFRFKMEHYLSDMGAASFSGDKYFLLLSESGFLRYAAASIFMENRRFEPSHRDIEDQLHALPRIPEDFWSAWDAILQKEREIPASKRFEVARLLANSVYSLSAH